jgi:hypothetical protein
MSILWGVLLGAAIALLVLVPVIGLQLTLRFFATPSASPWRQVPPADHGLQAPLKGARPRSVGLFRAIQ